MAGFDFSAALGASTVSGFIEPGVHNVKFVKIAHSTINTKNGESEVLALTLDVEGHGEYTQNFFKPNSKERGQGMYGPQPSQNEQFQIILREILEALNPDFAQDLESGKLVLPNNFKQIVTNVAAWAEEYAGKELKAKFLPQGNGYAQLPQYPASVNRSNKLCISNVFIGPNVTLSAAEQKKIKAAAVATPTPMAQTKATNTDDLLDNVADDLKDDLPF